MDTGDTLDTRDTRRDAHAVATRPVETPERHRRRVCMYVPSPGKTDARVMREATALAAAGYQVVVTDIEHGRGVPKREVVDGLEMQHVRMSRRSALNYRPRRTIPWLSFKIRRIARATVRLCLTRADVYHAHDMTGLPPCFVAAVLRRRPLVFDAHELPMVQAHLTRRRVLTSASTRVLRLLAARCSVMITVSPPLVEELHLRLGGPRGEVIRNIPDYQPPMRTNRIREHLGIPAQVRIALYQGMFEPNRSLDVLIRAAQYLDPSIVIALLGKGSLEQALRQEIARAGVEDRVKILPFVPNAELLSWTSSADVGLTLFAPEHSTSIRYCLPNKFFEYLMAGLPILTTPLDSIVEVVERRDLGRVVPDLDPVRVAQALRDMLGDDAALQRYRENALAAAARDLRWDVEREKLVDIYDRLTNL